MNKGTNLTLIAFQTAHKALRNTFTWVLLLFGLHASTALAAKLPLAIDRHALVTRHNLMFTTVNPQETMQVGNGEIAFGVDVTGLQTFYGNTLAQWGWHSFPLPEGKAISDFAMTPVEVHGRKVGYPITSDGQKELYTWLRENPHRLNLGRLSFVLDGKPIQPGDVTEIKQTLDLWHGVITSSYQLKGQIVQVETTCHPKLDALAVKVTSPLIANQALSIEIAFPYGQPAARDSADWKSPDRHETQFIQRGKRQVAFARRLDQDRYEATLSWEGNGVVQKDKAHTYRLLCQGPDDTLALVCQFSKQPPKDSNPTFNKLLTTATAHWESFWKTGGAIDLSGSKDKRWLELERRIVLSQYLLAINEAGSLPPQESGLLNNCGWSGKFHLEMHWWHGAHYGLWGRWDMFDRSLGWYRDILPAAKDLAKGQGYRGARWPKMVGPEGRDSPSNVGPLLIWQQPHPIFYAEEAYRINPSKTTLEKWQDIVFESAEFMASYAWKNPQTGKYDLGPMLKVAAEVNNAPETRNPAFELSYWRYGLRTAQSWRQRMGLAPNHVWQEVLDNLAPLPIEEGVYVLYEGVSSKIMWTKYNHSHTDVIGAAAFLPGDGVDWEVMARTFEKTMACYKMDGLWGWDFPWLAMAASRLNQPQKAIDALLSESKKNKYSACGVNMGGPANSYFPGNGGLLYAAAMMAAGWDGAPDRPTPGFPNDGSWVVKWEGLKKAP
jgi:hypothetical protein